MQINYAQIFYQELQTLPIFFLQEIALVGVVAIFLIFKGNAIISSKRSTVIGWGLGLSFFLLASFNNIYGDADIKHIIVTDFIFISAVIGGWRNALATLLIVSITRWHYWGAPNFHLALIDYVCIGIGGLVAHQFILRRGFINLTLRHLFVIALWRFLLSEASVAIIGLMGSISIEFTISTMIKRFLAAWTICLVTVSALLLIIKRHMEWERYFYTDQLSKIGNRRAFQRHLKENHALFEKKQIKNLAILLINIDNLQQLTQGNGHDWVDSFIIKLSGKFLNYSTKPPYRQCNANVFAFSGHSFTITLQNMTKNKIKTTNIAHNLLNELLIFSKENENDLQPSFTISVIDVVFSDQFNVIRFLRTMTFLEDQPIGGVQFCEPDIMGQVATEEYVRLLITEWINNGHAHIYLQPKVCLSQRSCKGAEALLRAYEVVNNGCHINPHFILQVAEKYGLRQDLEWAILREVVAHLERLPQHLQNISISVNLTPDVFNIPGFAKKITDLLKEKNIKANRLVIEIIETSKLAASDVVQNNITHLINNNVLLSLDDFGTGYASITLLSRYHFKELKLDYAMISNINNERMYSAIQLSIASANKYNALIVAEGIEDEDQYQQLLAMGITYGQGYLFGKAMPLQQFIDYATDNLRHTLKALPST